MNLRKGDIILTASNSWLGRRIRRYERVPGEAPSQVNHAAVVVRDGTLKTAEIVEALGQGVVNHTISKGYYGQPDRIRIYRAKYLTDGQRDAICIKALSMVGMKYGWGEILTHFGDWLMSRMFHRDVLFFRRLCRAKRNTICSVVVACAYQAAGLEPWGDPTTVQPDTIDDVCHKKYGEYELIRDLKKLGEDV